MPNDIPGPSGTALEPPQALRRRLDYDDQRLRSECVVETRRVRGPGGQHRNKVESAVRLFHRASGLSVTAQERRSQHENAANALERLREAIAVSVRVPLPERHVWPASVQIQQGRLRVSESNAAFFHVLALALDAFAAHRGVPQDAAAWLGVTPSSYTRFLADHAAAWREANRIRAAHGHPPLKA